MGNSESYTFRKIGHHDLEPLRHYLHNLSDLTKSRFGPHHFDRETIENLFLVQREHNGYIGVEKESDNIIAYAIIKDGYLDHDRSRLESYGLKLSMETDCTYAPSVGDQYQGMGIGKLLFRFILSDLKEKGIERIILWGGVQSGNDRAIAYYHHLGFIKLGQFEYQGMNDDMVLNLK